MKAVWSTRGAACCMLWVTMAMVNRALRPSIKLLDAGGRDRVERRAGLVEQDHLGLDRHRAGDAEALLLAAERLRPLAFSLSLTSFHSAAPCSAFSTRTSLSALETFLVEADPESDVLVDRHRERGRLLEHHADAGPQQVEVLVGFQDILAVEQHFALGPLARIKIVHAVEHAQQGGLAAARGADEGRHVVGAQRQRDTLEGQRVAVEELEVTDRDLVGPAPHEPARPHSFCNPR